MRLLNTFSLEHGQYDYITPLGKTLRDFDAVQRQQRCTNLLTSLALFLVLLFDDRS